MTPPYDDQREFAFLCDREGNLIQVFHDQLGVSEYLQPGKPWTVLLDTGSIQKALGFLATITLRGRAIGWEFNLAVQNRLELLHFAGTQTEKGLLVVGAAHPDLPPRPDQALNPPDGEAAAGQPALLFDEITRINNELMNLKRELDKKNVQLLQLTVELENRVKERTAELETANQRLQESMVERVRAEEKAFHNERLAAVGATVAEIAHELANPLNAIFATIQVAELMLDEPEVRRDSLASLIADVKIEFHRLKSLLGELRSSTAKRKLQFAPTDLRTLVTKFLALQSLELEQKRIKVVQEFAPELARVMADKDALTQVLLNLCKNAVEAMPEGGMLTLSGSNSGDQVVLEVIDTGAGISPGIDVFRPFDTTKSQGMGIGLAIVREIVSLHRGSITYTTEEGRGTAFRVNLPKA